MRITITAIRKRQLARFYTYKNQIKLRNVFIYKKPDTFKNQDNFRYVWVYKNPHTLRYTIFHKISDVGIIYKNYVTFCYVMFIYTKIQTLRKKQDNLHNFFMFKIWTLCVMRFFMEFLKLVEGE